MNLLTTKYTKHTKRRKRCLTAISCLSCFSWFIIFFFLFTSAHAQTTAPYLIPRQIFVGDPATLVVPLSATTTSNITVTTDLPTHDYIDFHKISLQGDRLLIEFSAFVPGEIELPLIEIAGHYFPNLKITVNSTIDRKNAIALSAPASSLVMPGTALMLYRTMAALAFILLASIWFVVKGKKLFALWREKWSRWRLFTNIRHTERVLYRATLKGADKRIILNKLSDAFRKFLSVLLNRNCRAMTAREISREITGGLNNDILTRCDDFRFSGAAASADDILSLLKDLRGFINGAEQWQN